MNINNLGKLHYKNNLGFKQGIHKKTAENIKTCLEVIG